MNTVLTREITERADAFIAENKEEIIDTLLRLVRIPSVKDTAAPDAPFGRACAALLDEVTALYKTLGLTPKAVPSRGYVIAEYGQGRKTLGIFAHGDVVPPGEGWLYTEPFSPVIRDDIIIGRGCNDDKSGLVQMLYAVKMLQALKLPLNNKLLLFTGTNEETGMEDIKSFAANEKMPDAAIVPDGCYPFYSGEKGRVTFTLRADKSFEKILSFTGGDCYNKVLDTATVVLPAEASLRDAIVAKIRDDTAISLSESGGRLQLTAKGITAHAAHPEDGINAAQLLSSLLASCEALPVGDRSILQEAATILGTHYGDALGLAGEDTVFGRLTCVNGMVRSDGGKLSLCFDVRYGLQITGDKILETIPQKAGWHITEHSGSDGYNLENTHPVAVALREAYSFVSGDERDGEKMAAGTYARHLQNAFSVGTIATYKGKVDFPEGHGGMHQPDEAISIDGFLEGIKILLCMILAVDAVL